MTTEQTKRAPRGTRTRVLSMRDLLATSELRDKLAIAALPVVFAHGAQYVYGAGDEAWDDVAVEAYRLADSMMKARSS